ncbi:MAG: HigA family addiction module antitoxin [bacterium]
MGTSKSVEKLVASLPTNREPFHPGTIILEEFLDELDMTQKELSERMGVPYARVNELIHGKRGVTIETALMLSRIFGTTAEMWLNMQRQYDLWQALHSEDTAKKIENVEPIRKAS